ncbi:NAD(P)-dependent oxidoreductase [Glaciihabitans sp. UYNi722]|uniref:NAD(P)-dependent oxidoreductase n=1 Tax=Glaciihabitans sp. UYNi722 TaxID=3156344 RepID=UPI0033978EA6
MYDIILSESKVSSSSDPAYPAEGQSLYDNKRHLIGETFMANATFIGLGTMGSGMAANLLKSGHSVTFWNRTQSAGADLERSGAKRASSIAEAVQGAEFVLYCLSNDEAVKAVVFGADGIAANASSDTIVIDLSTIDTNTSADEAAEYSRLGIRFLDAPVFGTRGEAASGGLWIVIGGDEEVFESARVVLEPLSETLHYMGKAGSGVRMKLVGNLLVAAQLESLGEALSLAKKAGLRLSDVLGVIHVADFRSPIYDGVGANVLAGDYSPDFALDLMLKDANLIRDFADRVGVRIPAASATRNVIQRAVEAGYASENASAFIKVIAEDAGVDLRE